MYWYMCLIANVLAMFPSCRAIWSDSGTRNLFSFLLINLSFAFVELLWGMWTNRSGPIPISPFQFSSDNILFQDLQSHISAPQSHAVWKLYITNHVFANVFSLSTSPLALASFPTLFTCFSIVLHFWQDLWHPWSPSGQ